MKGGKREERDYWRKMEKSVGTLLHGTATAGCVSSGVKGERESALRTAP